MTFNKNIRTYMRTLLALALVSFQTALPANAQQLPADQQVVTGELSVNGTVTINGVRAMNGDTVTENTVLVTDCKASALISIGRQGRMELAGGTDLTIAMNNAGVGGTLRSGRMTVSAPLGVAISVMTPDGSVTTDGREAAVIVIDRTLGNTKVRSQRSDAKIVAGNKVEYVAAGQEAAVGTQNPGSGTRCTPVMAAGGAPSTVPVLGGLGGGLGAGALTTLVIASIGGVVAGVAAAASSDSVDPGQVFASSRTVI
ncbi:MAG: hypothetical protein ACKV2V_12020 [Blastocatellia bacterium]